MPVGSCLVAVLVTWARTPHALGGVPALWLPTRGPERCIAEIERDRVLLGQLVHGLGESGEPLALRHGDECELRQVAEPLRKLLQFSVAAEVQPPKFAHLLQLVGDRSEGGAGERKLLDGGGQSLRELVGNLRCEGLALRDVELEDLQVGVAELREVALGEPRVDRVAQRSGGHLGALSDSQGP
eukprot:UN2081